MDPRDFEYSRGLEYPPPFPPEDELDEITKRVIDEVIRESTDIGSDIDGIV